MTTRPVVEISDRSRLVCFLLCLLGCCGVCGLHRLYAGRVISGLIQLATVGLFGIWQVWDAVVILLGAFRDGDGRLVD